MQLITRWTGNVYVLMGGGGWRALRDDKSLTRANNVERQVTTQLELRVKTLKFKIKGREVVE